MHWSDDQLIAHPPGNMSGLALNTTAAIIYQLCDGSRSLKFMVEELYQASHETAGKLDMVLSDTIKQLFHRGLVELKPTLLRPVLGMGFTGFNDSFDIHDNFFLNLFSEWVDILIVTPDEQPDILVVSSCKTDGYKNSLAVLSVLLDETGNGDATGFDLVFTTDIGRLKHASSAIILPPNFQVTPRPEIGPQDRQRIGELFSPGSHETDKVYVPDKTVRKKLTIGMATYDDYDGVYFTVQALRLFHPEVTDETEILIVDNNPNGVCANHLQTLAEKVEGCRYVANNEIRGTAVRDFVFREACTDYVMCIDSHVFIESGAIRKLIEYFEANPGSPDLLQGPLLDEDMRSISTHFNPVWKQGMFGIWGLDERGLDPDNEPFDIPMQGMGLAACRKTAWQGYNPRFRGFGGEEGYIHQKFRNAKSRTLCLPFLRWMHRFARPRGAPYDNLWEDRIRIYLIGFEDVGLDTDDVCEHFREYVSAETIGRVLEQISNEQNNPFDFFEAIYCINLAGENERWLSLQRRLQRLGILHRIKRFEAIETSESHHVGCALSHRKIVEEARDKGYRNVLVLEDDVMFHEKTLDYLRQSITELKDKKWNVFYLGGMRWGKKYSKLPQCNFLDRPQGMTCAHALAYHFSFYEKLLNDLPAAIEDMQEWVKTHAAIDKYLPKQQGLVVMSQVVATQATILKEEDEWMRDDYY